MRPSPFFLVLLGCIACGGKYESIPSPPEISAKDETMTGEPARPRDQPGGMPESATPEATTNKPPTMLVSCTPIRFPGDPEPREIVVLGLSSRRIRVDDREYTLGAVDKSGYWGYANYHFHTVEGAYFELEAVRGNPRHFRTPAGVAICDEQLGVVDSAALDALVSKTGGKNSHQP